ncbi:anti-sigma factor [Pseudomonas sp. Bc-h]|jgi:anti-sigma-K factor RskA|uniref:anti-sigma factor n=1 Tax=unclassified Pseudomonas TaxID=196821 RepID=UPI0009D9392B|nr:MULTISPECIES: anti-sigma factor [unclassified Pseudomonas]MDE1197254.1 anti-sigma factor [Pseudomonas sp.]OQR33887.1 anti-sigma factor [Pseudomonas sp. Bc-h]
MNYRQPELRRALAADYAIGLMPTTARRRFENLLIDDPNLRAEVAQWQESLVGLTTSLEPQPVPERVWQQIVARIEPQRLHVPEKRPFWSWMRIAAVACTLLVAVIVGVIYNRDKPDFNATLVAGNQQPALTVQAFDRYLKIDPVAVASVETGRSLELWAIPADGVPVSLGVIPDNGKGRVDLSDSQRRLLGSQTTMAITLEPKGGSPSGKPTGPILYKGQLASL